MSDRWNRATELTLNHDKRADWLQNAAALQTATTELQYIELQEFGVRAPCSHATQQDATTLMTHQRCLWSQQPVCPDPVEHEHRKCGW